MGDGSVLIVLYVATLSFAIINGTDWIKGDMYTGWKIPKRMQTSTVHVAKNLVQCATLCYHNGTCTGVHFSATEKTCRHIYDDTCEIWEGNNTDSIVFFKEMKVVLVAGGPDYVYTFQEAKTVCAKTRGRLITISHMMFLWFNDGYQACSCGWVADGSNVLPDRGGCQSRGSFTFCDIDIGHAFCNLD